MNKKIVLLVIAGAALAYGWAWQNRNNNAKIEVLSRTLAQLEQNQSRQMAGMQTQLIGLAPTLDKINDSYFEKSQDKAIFFHTNTLYLILMVDKKIESQLHVAETERTAQIAQEYGYYTNQLASLLLCTAMIQGSQTNSESRIVESVNAETKRLASVLSVELQKQIILAATDPAGVARQKQIVADLAQMKVEVEQIKAALLQPAANKLLKNSDFIVTR